MPSTRRAFLTAALVAAAGCSASPVGGDASADGTTTSRTGPTTTPGGIPERWSYEPPFDEVGTLSLAPGAGGPAVYVGSAGAGNPVTGETPTDHDQGLVAISLADRAEQWRRAFDFHLSDVASPREAMSTTVYVGDYGGRLLALSPLDGTTRWTYPVEGDGFRPRVQRTSESLSLGSVGVHALDPVSGEARWSFTPDVDGSVHVHASTTVFARADDRIWALDPATGDVRWRYDAASGIRGVASAGDFAFVADGGTVRALDGRSAG